MWFWIGDSSSQRYTMRDCTDQVQDIIFAESLGVCSVAPARAGTSTWCWGLVFLQMLSLQGEAKTCPKEPMENGVVVVGK
jgi:hypothetical protein